ILILISLPTSQPPVSSAWFHVRPQFSRSIFVSAEKKARCPPKGSLICPLYSVFSVTGLVTPRIVRSPWIFQSSPPSCSTRLLVNVSSGNTSTSRKSGLRRCVALLGARVDAGRLDGHADARLRRVIGDVQRAFELAEAALDLGHHQVPGLELDRRVRGVEHPRARAGELDAVPDAARSARCDCLRHGLLLVLGR